MGGYEGLILRWLFLPIRYFFSHSYRPNFSTQLFEINKGGNTLKVANKRASLNKEGRRREQTNQANVFMRERKWGTSKRKAE